MQLSDWHKELLKDSRQIQELERQLSELKHARNCKIERIAKDIKEVEDYEVLAFVKRAVGIRVGGTTKVD